MNETEATSEIAAEEATPEVSFADTISKIPYTPATEEGKGFLPLVSRSIGHILYLIGRYDDTAKSKPTKARAKEEIDGALTHWSNLDLEKASFSSKSTEEIQIIGTSLHLASEQIESWEDKDVLLNIQKLVNRMVQLMANLDREVLGIRDSDAGINL